MARIMIQPQHNHTIPIWTRTSQTPAARGEGGETSECLIRVELSVSLLDRTEELMAAKKRLQEWTSEVWLATMLQSSWVWPC